MPLPAQFELGLELTNIVAPLTTALSSLGSLAIADRIKRAGSDVITEIKLASLLGRHRIDPIMKVHFKEIVAKSDQSVISRYIDIILESGAGPTVQEALKNPALFSMVVQLSLLAFAHEDESLANAMVAAIEDILRDSGNDLENAPDYVSLLGTIRACQQQTAAFKWSSFYIAVENKIQTALKVSREKKRPKKIRNILGGIGVRCLPFAVLKLLIMWLQSLQSFPEHRILHLRCNSGISTVIIWCHYVLGLKITVKLDKENICFGEGGSHIILEESSNNSGGCILDPADQNEPLFSLSMSTDDVEINFESRANAFGYGVELIKLCKDSFDLKYISHWIIAHCIVRACESVKNSKGLTSYDNVVKGSSPSQEMLIRAGSFLFALDVVDHGLLDKEIRNSSPEPTFQKLIIDCLFELVFIFARIRDLDLCKGMPLSLKKGDIYDRPVSYQANHTNHLLGLPRAFKTLCRLLLGHCFSQEYIKPAVLVSSWGWSIFLDSIDATDPLSVSTETLQVMRGVPSRKGTRKARIIDGPMDDDCLWAGNPRHDNGIQFLPGIETAKRGRALVGHHSADAFSIIQSFSLRLLGDDSNSEVKIGFREMFNRRFTFYVLRSCECSSTLLDVSGCIDNEIYKKESIQKLSVAESPSHYEIKWPIGDVGPDHGREFERHYHPNPHIIETADEALTVRFLYVTQNVDAKWLQIHRLYKLDERNWHLRTLRDSECCVSCALNVPLHEFNKAKGIVLL